MRHPEPFKALTDSFRGKRSIPDPIASDTLTFRDAKGRKRKARIEIGAVTILRGFHDHVGGMHITYATSEGRLFRRRRKKATAR